ncbi:Isochorismatase-like protein [Lophiotrema nucula]|uniref:Isochorismatase-like protein n=1 Tax=Lophiotrema nucula TaxID=690887 RepID=A0A6A5YPF3_9PLEO|nr:Isochorismatase-like protein [Lophiotrema nucula]
MSPSQPKTALIFIDPYNDFLHPSGKLYPALADSLIESNTIEHIRTLLPVVREQKIPIYYCLHQQYKPDFYTGWKHMTTSHHQQKENKVFEEGSWGAQILEGLEPKVDNGDVVTSKHWNSRSAVDSLSFLATRYSFNNTDLDFQLRQREITHVVLAGLTANACMEATARYAYDMGYHVTMLSDATAGFTVEQKKAATDIIWPLFADVLTVDEYVASLRTEGLKAEDVEGL